MPKQLPWIPATAHSIAASRFQGHSEFYHAKRTVDKLLEMGAGEQEITRLLSFASSPAELTLLSNAFMKERPEKLAPSPTLLEHAVFALVSPGWEENTRLPSPALPLLGTLAELSDKSLLPESDLLILLERWSFDPGILKKISERAKILSSLKESPKEATPSNLSKILEERLTSTSTEIAEELQKGGRLRKISDVAQSLGKSEEETRQSISMACALLFKQLLKEEKPPEQAGKTE